LLNDKFVEKFWFKKLLAIFAGACMTLSYAPFNYWPMSFFCFAIIIWLVKPTDENTTVKKSAQLGFYFGLGWFGVGISWVHVAIADFGGLPLIISLLLMLILCAYLALYPALAFALSCKLYQYKRPSSSRSKYCLLHWFSYFSICFILMETLRGIVLTGFPWLSLGYILTDSPLNFLSPIIGEFGLSFVVLILSFAGYLLFQTKQVWFLLASLSILFITLLISPYLSNTQHQDKQVKVLLVQGNIEQQLKWNPDHAWSIMQKYQDLTRKNWDVDLVVWPEAAISKVEYLAGDFLTQLDSTAAFNNTALITGIVDYQFDTKTIYNNLIVVGKRNSDSKQGHYHYLHDNRYTKHKLLPIGEFVPFEDILRPLAPLFNLAMSSFSAGEAIQKNLVANGLNILPANCFEIVFSHFLRQNYQTNSDLLLTVSNDAWFGDSHGPHQHMQIARMRSQELRLPLLRVTNNGITAVYDPIDDIQQSTPQFETNVLKTQVKTISGDTFYSQHGDKPMRFLLLLIFLCAVLATCKQIKTNQTLNLAQTK
jgi:apolipoprotein N-acyltransferase